MSCPIQEAVAKLPSGPLSEETVQRHIAPLFSRVLANDRVYLANHSLGRPLDKMAEDVREGITLWETKLGDAWDEWLAEQDAFRGRIAKLIGAPRVDCVVPKTSAGQGLRAILNVLHGRPRVLSTRGEFDSLDLILKQYAALGRIEMEWLEPDGEGRFTVADMVQKLRFGVDLVVISQVMFMDGQIVHDLPVLADACHAVGARLLVDAYHAVGVIPVDVAAMHADFAIGGSYKYLRGGPGACFLYISPEALATGLRVLDTGWFAREDIFGYERHDPPLLRAGGDAFLESTPPVLTYYQARSGQMLALALGVERMRAYGLEQLSRLKGYLRDAGIDAIGADSDHGAFLAVQLDDAAGISAKLAEQGVITDARGPWLRLCPDCLTRDQELRGAAAMLAEVLERARS
ncbi:aminotransferase class V-fold PLP-dependent enzyme [Alloacidobacterium dinghuense]|uniref:Aminotransferase class V-fold PLP-dependent enzyme n=1 Tax=Alloacidobacterium dinghuense TaxID=2763107 RepID=A0A7G8BPJ5_9BACT|nr:aminotransferase class V-fold PLP-dependent enzyme [Alloacidobacterium dinghuense]QNI34465.1 aminotransferase class V-fold PLP-dependent enzyme [Alloacidobacterium dinghuense]